MLRRSNGFMLHSESFCRTGPHWHVSIKGSNTTRHQSHNWLADLLSTPIMRMHATAQERNCGHVMHGFSPNWGSKLLTEHCWWLQWSYSFAQTFEVVKWFISNPWKTHIELAATAGAQGVAYHLTLAGAAAATQHEAGGQKNETSNVHEWRQSTCNPKKKTYQKMSKNAFLQDPNGKDPCPQKMFLCKFLHYQKLRESTLFFLRVVVCKTVKVKKLFMKTKGKHTDWNAWCDLALVHCSKNIGCQPHGWMKKTLEF